MAIFRPGKLWGALDALDDSTPGHVIRGGRPATGASGRRVGARVETPPFRPPPPPPRPGILNFETEQSDLPNYVHAHMGEVSSRVLWN